MKAGNWAVKRLQQAGISNARLMETETHPIVYGDWLQAGGNKLTVHIYEHFDMQPAEPLAHIISSNERSKRSCNGRRLLRGLGGASFSGWVEHCKNSF